MYIKGQKYSAETGWEDWEYRTTKAEHMEIVQRVTHHSHIPLVRGEALTRAAAVVLDRRRGMPAIGDRYVTMAVHDACDDWI